MALIILLMKDAIGETRSDLRAEICASANLHRESTGTEHRCRAQAMSCRRVSCIQPINDSRIRGCSAMIDAELGESASALAAVV